MVAMSKSLILPAAWIRGAQFGETAQSVYWRNYLFSNLASIVGPVIAAGLCQVRFLGRRGTMVIGALVTMAFFFAYTSGEY